MSAKIEDLKDRIILIKRNLEEIIEEIPQEDIDLYVFIQMQFNKLRSGTPGKRFKQLFTLFYGRRIYQIPNYFDKLFDANLYNDIHKIENFDGLKKIYERLLDSFHSDSGKNQYSYISKLIHTINPDFPIYDNYVKIALGLKDFDTEQKRKEFWNQIYKKINDTYQEIIKKELLKDVIEDFSIKRDITHMNNIKILDFLFWGAGVFREAEELKKKYVKEKYEVAAYKYKPDKIKYLLIAESPPYKLTKEKEMKYFYFDKISEGDALLENTVESIFSEEYDKSKKGFWLKKLQSKGFFLIDAVDYPINQIKDDEKRRNRHVRINFNNLIEKLDNLGINKDTKIILIKKNVFEILADKLKEKDFNVINEKLLPFPGRPKNSNRFQMELKELLMKDKDFSS